METECFSEMFASTYKSTRHNNIDIITDVRTPNPTFSRERPQVFSQGASVYKTKAIRANCQCKIACDCSSRQTAGTSAIFRSLSASSSLGSDFSALSGMYTYTQQVLRQTQVTSWGNSEHKFRPTPLLRDTDLYTWENSNLLLSVSSRLW
jgi:hypothetical protein